MGGVKSVYTYKHCESAKAATDGRLEGVGRQQIRVSTLPPKKKKEKERKLRLLFYLDLVVEVAQLLAQFSVARLAFAVLAGALVFLVAAPAVLARQLRFHRRAHAALLDRTL